jgi:hypothetical protein
LKDVDNDDESKKRNFPKPGRFKLLQFDIVLATEEESELARAQLAK